MALGSMEAVFAGIGLLDDGDSLPLPAMTFMNPLLFIFRMTLLP